MSGWTRVPSHIRLRTLSGRVHRTPASSRPLNTSVSSNPPRHTAGNSVEPLHGSALCAPYTKPSHHCGALDGSHVGQNIVLAGRLLPERKINKRFSFFPLKDAQGTAQLVVSDDLEGDVLNAMSSVPSDSAVLIEGTVRLRPPSHRRPDPSGDIEVVVSSFTLLNPADRKLPFASFDTHNLVHESIRLRYRYLDLRRTVLSHNLKKRSDVAQTIRRVLHNQDFTEVETPILLKSTPEGAREYLVPTRIKPASSPSVDELAQPLFYALSQSPQQPKQLLIASGAVDRYYQFARCFRDEDGRKDRQPEFTQVDLEMAWVSWGEPKNGTSSKVAPSGESSVSTPPVSTGISPVQVEHYPNSWRIGGGEVRDIVQKIIRQVWSTAEQIELPSEFQVMTYREAMNRYGSDKPDVRFGLEIQDVTPYLSAGIRDALHERDEILQALVVRKGADQDNPFVSASEAIGQDRYEVAAIERIVVKSSDDLSWLGSSRLLHEGLNTGGSTLYPTAPDHNINLTLGLTNGGTLFLARRKRRPEGGSTPLGRLRLALSAFATARGDLTLPTSPHFLWVTEFPLFTRADADKEFLAHGRWSSSHHPFTAPMWEDIPKLYASKIDEIRGQHYDLVLDGVEIGGGSVRVHDAAMQEYIFSQVLQLDESEKSAFDHLLHALRCGAPPHGGIALGFDRLMAILCRTESIRDVIAFPKTSVGTDLLFKSPSAVDPAVLAQYNIGVLGAKSR